MDLRIVVLLFALSVAQTTSVELFDAEHSYNYKLEAYALSSGNGASKATSLLYMCDVLIRVPVSYQFELQLSGCELKQKSPGKELDNDLENFEPSKQYGNDFIDELSIYKASFVLEENDMTAVRFHRNESLFAKNVKRSIISNLLSDRDVPATMTRVDNFGECILSFTSEDYGQRIEMTRDWDSCKLPETKGSWDESKTQINFDASGVMSDFTDSKSSCVYEILNGDNSVELKTITCTDEHKYMDDIIDIPGIGLSSQIQSKFTLTGVTKDTNEIKINTENFEDFGIVHEHEVHEREESLLKGKIISSVNLNKAKETFTKLNHHDKASAEQLNSLETLTSYLQGIKVEEKLGEFVEYVKKCEFTKLKRCSPEQQEMAMTYLQYALLECNTALCVDALYQLNEQNTFEKDFMMNAFRYWAYAGLPDESSVLKTMKILNRMDTGYANQDNTILYAGKTLRTFYENNLNKYGNEIPQELEEAVKLILKHAESFNENHGLAIGGIGNIGELAQKVSPGHLDWLLNKMVVNTYSQGERDIITINKLVVDAIRNLDPTDRIHDELLKIYKNDELNIESRVMAYRTLSERSTTTEGYDELLSYMNEIPLKHPMKRFVLSHMHNYIMDEDNRETDSWKNLKKAMKPYFGLFEDEHRFKSAPIYSHNFLSTLETFKWDSAENIAQILEILNVKMDVDVMADFGKLVPDSFFINTTLNPGDRAIYLGQLWSQLGDLNMKTKLFKIDHPLYKPKAIHHFLKSLMYSDYFDKPEKKWNLSKDDNMITAIKQLRKDVNMNNELYGIIYNWRRLNYKGSLIRSPLDWMAQNLGSRFHTTPRFTGYYVIPSVAGLTQTISTDFHLSYSNTADPRKPEFVPSVGAKIVNNIKICIPEYTNIGLRSTSLISTHFEIKLDDGKLMLPKDKMTMISFSHRNEYLTNEAFIINMGNAKTETKCMDEKFEDITGYKVCSLKSVETDATDFYKYELSAEKTDKKLEYIQFDADSTRDMDGKHHTKISANAPGDKYKREIAVEMLTDTSNENLVTSKFTVSVPEFPSLQIGYDFEFNKTNYDMDLDAKVQFIAGRFARLEMKKNGPENGVSNAYFNVSTHRAHVSAEVKYDSNENEIILDLDCLFPKRLVDEYEMLSVVPIEFWEEDEQHLKVNMNAKFVNIFEVDGKISLPRHVTDWSFRAELAEDAKVKLQFDMYHPKTPEDQITVTLESIIAMKEFNVKSATLKGPYRSLEYTRDEDVNEIEEDSQNVVTKTLLYKRHLPETKENTVSEFKLVKTYQSSCKGCGIYPGANEDNVSYFTTTTFYFPLRGKQHWIKTTNYLVELDVGAEFEESVFNTKVMLAPISIVDMLDGKLDISLDVMHTPSGAITKNKMKLTTNLLSSDDAKIKIDLKITSKSKSHDFQSTLKYYEDEGIEKLSHQTTLTSDVWKDIEFNVASSSEIYPRGEKTNWLNDDAKYKYGTTSTKTHWLEPKGKYLKSTTIIKHDPDYKLVPSMTWETNFRDFRDYSFRVTYPKSKEMLYAAANVSDDYMNAHFLTEYTDASGVRHHFGDGNLEPLLPYTLYFTFQRNQSLSRDLTNWTVYKIGQLVERVTLYIESADDPNHPANLIWSPILGGKTIAKYFTYKLGHVIEVAENVIVYTYEPKESWQVVSHPFVKLGCNLYMLSSTDAISNAVEEVLDTSTVSGRYFNVESLLESLESAKRVYRDGMVYVSQIITTPRSFSNFKEEPKNFANQFYLYSYRNPVERQAIVNFHPFRVNTFDARPINFHMAKECPVLLAHDFFGSNFTLTGTPLSLTFIYTPYRPLEEGPRDIYTINLNMERDPIQITGISTNGQGVTQDLSFPFEYNNDNDEFTVNVDSENVEITTKAGFNMKCCRDCYECKITTSIWNTNSTLGLLGNADGYPSNDMKLPNGHLTNDVTKFVKSYLLDQSEDCKSAVSLYDTSKCTSPEGTCDGPDDEFNRMFYYYKEDCKYETKCGRWSAEDVLQIYNNRRTSILDM